MDQLKQSAEELELDYERDTQIDESALDIEWLRQPDLVRRYTKYAAETRRYMEELKERLELKKAQLDLDIRKNPHDYDLDKVTEAAIQSTILAHSEYQELLEKYREARYENSIANGVVEALQHKRDALENLVKLLGQNYFAGPTAPRNLEEGLKDWLDKTKRRGTNARVRMRRRNRDDEEQYEE